MNNASNFKVPRNGTYSRTRPPSLAIRPNTLQPGVTYAFRLLLEEASKDTASNPSSSSAAFGDVKVVVNAVPKNGQVHVSDSDLTGFAGNDTFTFVTDSWSNEGGDALSDASIDRDSGLSYRFFLVRNSSTGKSAGKRLWLTGRQSSPTFQGKLPAGNFRVCVLAYGRDLGFDADGKCYKDVVQVKQQVIKSKDFLQDIDRVSASVDDAFAVEDRSEMAMAITSTLSVMDAASVEAGSSQASLRR